ncbi:hypothetical protein HYR54_12295 [Candidatus Acetothermia bacterium]|nr:hypothetical protein [Candidatus Acetothermia bacterium]
MSHFRLPDLLLKLRCETPRRIYSAAWAISDSAGTFTLYPNKFGIPKRTLQHWAKYFIQWKLWQVVDAAGGRGKRATYRISGKAEYLQQQAKTKPRKEAVKKQTDKKSLFSTPRATDKTFHRPKRLDWLQDRQTRWAYAFSGWTTLQKNAYGYKMLARCLRLNFWELGADKQSNETLVSIAMNFLEGKPVAECKRLCYELLRWVAHQRDKFMRLLEHGRRAFSWVAWLLAKFMKREQPESKPKASSAVLRGHRPGCECIECERERVGHRRAQANREYGRRPHANWAQWALDWENHDSLCRCQFCKLQRVSALKHSEANPIKQAGVVSSCGALIFV